MAKKKKAKRPVKKKKQKKAIMELPPDWRMGMARIEGYEIDL